MASGVVGTSTLLHAVNHYAIQSVSYRDNRETGWVKYTLVSIENFFVDTGDLHG